MNTSYTLYYTVKNRGCSEATLMFCDPLIWLVEVREISGSFFSNKSVFIRKQIKLHIYRDVRCRFTEHRHYRHWCHWRTDDPSATGALNHWKHRHWFTGTPMTPAPLEHWITGSTDTDSLEHRWLSVTEAPKNWKHWHRCHWGTDDGYITDHWTTEALRCNQWW
jgi:hypothetical protein